MSNQPFLGRTRELEVLEKAFRRGSSGFIPVYGRRRVGKSELILTFLRGKQALYFLGKKAPAALQIREFLEIAALTVNEPLLATYPATHWGEAIQAVIERKAPGQKLVLALDEFQWIAEASPELPSVLQGLWDRQWQHSDDV
ncbi:MAG: AAA family ATPase, partial [Acidobacteriota bacterium]